jgi:hypothetical protein
MPVHYFEVFEFKSRFESDCLSVFKNLKPFSIYLLTPIPIPIWPVLFSGPVRKSARAPPLSPAARSTTLPFQPTAARLRFLAQRATVPATLSARRASRPSKLPGPAQPS